VVVVIEQPPIVVPVIPVYKKRRVPIGEFIAASRTRAAGSAAS
jgi:hypothetical protein